MPVRISPEATILILRAGPEFERALQERTGGELVQAGAASAETPSWAEVQAKPMDLSRAVISLGSNLTIANELGQPLWAWVDCPV